MEVVANLMHIESRMRVRSYANQTSRVLEEAEDRHAAVYSFTKRIGFGFSDRETLQRLLWRETERGRGVYHVVSSDTPRYNAQPGHVRVMSAHVFELKAKETGGTDVVVIGRCDAGGYLPAS